MFVLPDIKLNDSSYIQFKYGSISVCLKEQLRLKLEPTLSNIADVSNGSKITPPRFLFNNAVFSGSCENQQNPEYDQSK